MLGERKVMIYELHGKIPQNSSFIYSEDVLTSTIFGNLRYFSSNTLLNSFLSKARNLNSENFLASFSENLVINFWKKYASKQYSQINEPDLILEDENQVLIIECKYHSPLDENFTEDDTQYMNQLLRYSSILDEYYCEKKKKTIIFLTLKDYNISEVFKRTQKKLSNDIGLYWLHWEDLFTSLKKDINTIVVSGEKRLAQDLIDFLLLRQLKYFTGLNISSFNFSWKYKKNKKYIFSLKFEKKTWRYIHE